MSLIKLAIVLARPSLYYSVWESAQLLGGRRLDNQNFDEIGWWTRSISLEFEIPNDKIERFEMGLRNLYEDYITICYERSAALAT